ncbi:hypothetical protein NPIL_12121 [Nephila pilipes]|uniref:Uncharacterized protein n=1 Tax=Nephila pilipes TaxID=299642 RepID=A0A8X6QXP9_NEPPI|nr:hypothetical protein NPIL_12121 [Nephila pilipes]
MQGESCRFISFFALNRFCDDSRGLYLSPPPNLSSFCQNSSSRIVTVGVATRKRIVPIVGPPEENNNGLLRALWDLIGPLQEVALFNRKASSKSLRLVYRFVHERVEGFYLTLRGADGSSHLGNN